MEFSERLIKKGQPILKQILKHPFVEGIGQGDVSKDALAFYVGQDFNYLNAFMKVYAAAIQKSNSRDQIQLFTNQIEFTLNSEIQPHIDFCKVAGIEYSTVQNDKQAPMTYLYNEHMYNAARTGDLIDVVASMLPCPWTYSVIGETLIERGSSTESNPFKSWIDFYAGVNSEDKMLSVQLFDILDLEASKYSDEKLKEVEDRFLKSCELEWHFWDQAYYQRDWKFV